MEQFRSEAELASQIYVAGVVDGAGVGAPGIGGAVGAVGIGGAVGAVGIDGVGGMAGTAGDAAGVGVICATRIGSLEPAVAVAPALVRKAMAKATCGNETLRMTSLSEIDRLGLGAFADMAARPCDVAPSAAEDRLL